MLSAGTGAAEELWEGFQAFDGGDYPLAAKIFRDHAEAGDPLAQIALANLYRNGHGVPRDLPRAIALYTRAARAGSADAQQNLGDLLARGVGFGPDPAKAYYWLTRAWVQGRAWAGRRRAEIRPALDPATAAEIDARARRDQQ